MIEGNHLNRGYIFSKAYESEYARNRRVITCNLGLTKEMVNSMEREKSLKQDSSTIPMQKPLQSQLGIENLTIKKSCPQCALILYHTDLFNLDWLSRCPIHQCELLSVCPSCHKPWPKINEIWKRDCQCCSRFEITQFRSFLDNDAASYQEALKPLHNLISFKMDGKLKFINLQTTNNGWIEIDIDNPLFPTYQYQRYRGEKIASKDWASWKVRNEKVCFKRFSLLPISKAPKLIKAVKNNEHYRGTFSKKKTRQLKIDFKVMTLLLDLIKGNKSCKHKVQIISYRKLSLIDFLDAPPPCIYCMALSLWFFHTASRQYGEAFHLSSADYPFFDELKFGDFFLPEALSIIQDGQTFYKSEPALSQWTYSRSLQLSFIHLFEFITFLVDRIQFYKEFRYLLGKQPEHFVCNTLKNRYYLMGLDKNTLSVYFEKQNPLDSLKVVTEEALPSQCLEFNRFYKKDVTKEGLFPEITLRHNFTYKDFTELHLKFQNFNKLRVKEWSFQEQGHYEKTLSFRRFNIGESF